MAFENENSYNEGARFLKLRRDFPLNEKEQHHYNSVAAPSENNLLLVLCIQFITIHEQTVTVGLDLRGITCE